MTDALGNELVIGQKYGYSSSDGSLVNVVVGTLRSIGEKKVTLDVISRTYYAYGKKSQWQEDPPKTASVQGCHLFLVKD